MLQSIAVFCMFTVFFWHIDACPVQQQNNSCFTAAFPSYTGVDQQPYTAASSTSPCPSHLHFSTRILSCPFPPPGSMTSSAFPVLSYFAPQTTWSFSPNHYHPSAARPNHLNLFHFMVSDTDSISILFLSSALGTLSLSDTPHIHLTILISVCSNLPLCSAVMAHISLP